jgi:hypothetical protein
MTCSHRSPLLGLVVSLTVLAPVAALAELDSVQLKCHETISKFGSKIADRAVKEFVSCHKKRTTGRLPESTNCNEISQADTKNKVAAAAAKLQSGAAARCGGQTPADLNYGACPAPCDARVPAVVDFTDVSDCITCIAESSSQDMSLSALGLPTPPLPRIDAKCHNAIGKNQRKQFSTVIKERRKCQKSGEAGGATDTSSCSRADPNGKIADLRAKTEASIMKSCDVEGIDLFAVDSCNKILPILLSNCVLDGADSFGNTVFVSLYELGAAVVTTTTVQVTTTTNSLTTTSGSNTTTTTLGNGQDPLCPASGEIVVYAGVRETPCLTNADCDIDGDPVGICDDLLGRCVTATGLDAGWTGIAHGQDINDQISVQGLLRCPGPFDGGSSEPCGACEVAGLDTANMTLCRCATDNGVLCTEKFDFDATSCGVSGISCSVDDDCRVCDQTTSQSCLDDEDCPGKEVCLVGPRQPSCLNNMCVGACDCYFGPPLPLSAGNVPACTLNKFANDVSGAVNVDRGSGEITANLATLVYLGELITVPCPYCEGDVTLNDGTRDGTCVLGEDAGKPCDVQVPNLTFPSPSGGGHSLDCFPSAVKNVSGSGLKISMAQTTGIASLSAGVECGFLPFDPQLCQCGVCSDDLTAICTSNAECAALGTGTCGQAGQGDPRANQCTAGDVCVDLGGGLGECSSGPVTNFCDGALRSGGEPYVTCLSDSDCDSTDCGGGVGVGLCGTCSLARIRECFLPTIEAVGFADPRVPIGAATFCIPATEDPGVNSTVGLPGPARVTHQTRARAFCSSDPGIEYTPGAGGCPAP